MEPQLSETSVRAGVFPPLTWKSLALCSGNDYANFCLAECEGVEGECKGECPCGDADYQDYPYPSQILNNLPLRSQEKFLEQFLSLSPDHQYDN